MVTDPDCDLIDTDAVALGQQTGRQFDALSAQHSGRAGPEVEAQHARDVFATEPGKDMQVRRLQSRVSDATECLFLQIGDPRR